MRCRAAATWGIDAIPPILAPKSVTGEYGGGFLASLVLAVQLDSFGPTPGFRDEDPELDLTPHDGRPLDPARTVLASTHGAGGSAAWVFLEHHPRTQSFSYRSPSLYL